MLTIDQYGTQVFDRDGMLVRTSKNLRGMRDYARVSPVFRVTAYPFKANPLRGVLIVEYENGSTCKAGFASYCVLLEWLCNRRSWRAAPFWSVAPAIEQSDFFRTREAFDYLQARGLTDAKPGEA